MQRFGKQSFILEMRLIGESCSQLQLESLSCIRPPKKRSPLHLYPNTKYYDSPLPKKTIAKKHRKNGSFFVLQRRQQHPNSGMKTYMATASPGSQKNIGLFLLEKTTLVKYASPVSAVNPWEFFFLWANDKSISSSATQISDFLSLFTPGKKFTKWPKRSMGRKEEEGH